MNAKEYSALEAELSELYLDGEYDLLITKWNKAYEWLTVQQQLSLRRRLLSEWRSPQVWNNVTLE